MKEQILRVLKEAVETMNSGGKHWTKDKFTDDEADDGAPRFCSIGAIYHVLGVDLTKLNHGNKEGGFREVDRKLCDEVVLALAAAIPEEERDFPSYAEYALPDGMIRLAGWNITAWNDRDIRTWDDVVDVFDLAQEQVEARAS